MSNKPTILAIDDEIKALNLLKLTLEASGFNIEIASEGSYGIELAQKKHFDLIILDIKMPDIDGWAICRTLKHLDMSKDIPVIFLSAIADNIKGKFLSSGALKFVPKPVDPCNLIEIIYSIINHPTCKG